MLLKRIKLKISNDLHFEELLRGSLVSFFFRLLGIGLGYVFVLLVTRNYGTETMGFFTLSFTVLQIAMIISIFGMDTLILRFTGEYAGTGKTKAINSVYKKVILFVVPTSIFVSVGVYYSASFVATTIFNNLSLISFFEVASFGILPGTLLYIHREALRGLKKIMIFSFFNNITISLFASASLFIFSINLENNLMPLYAHVLALAISAILSILAWKLCFSTLVVKNKKGGHHLSMKHSLSSREMLIISFPMMLSSSLLLIMNWTDTIILGLYQGASEIGVYSVALKIALLTSVMLTAVNSISAPKFAEMWGKRDLKGLEKVVKQSTKMIFWSTLPILFLIFLFPMEILSFFGSDFSSGVIVLLVLTVGQLVNAISGSVGTLLSMTGHQIIVQNVLLFSIIVNVILNLLLIDDFGMLGVAVATMASTVLWNVLMNYYIWKKLGFITINFGLSKITKSC